MSAIRSVIIKTGTGFLYGVGFAFAVALIGSAMISFYDSKSESVVEKSTTVTEYQSQSIYKEYDQSAKLQVAVSRETINENEFTLIGAIENGGESKWSAIELRAELYNKDGEFIDECSEYISQTSSPGSKLNFKLSCGSCSKFKLEGYSSYNLSITNARNVQ